MSIPEKIENGNPEEVACLMVPITGKALLVPSVCIAEMVPFHSVTPVAKSPDWLLGNFYWREQQLPLISFEQMSGGSRPDLHGKCRVAVLNTTGQSEKFPFLAIMTQGIPRLARVLEEEIQAQQGTEKPFELMAVSLAGEEAVIPDMAAIESAWLNLNLA